MGFMKPSKALALGVRIKTMEANNKGGEQSSRPKPFLKGFGAKFYVRWRKVQFIESRHSL